MFQMLRMEERQILVQYTCELDVNLHDKWTSSFETNLCNEEKFNVEPISCLFPFDCLNVESSPYHHYINYRFLFFSFLQLWLRLQCLFKIMVIVIQCLVCSLLGPPWTITSNMSPWQPFDLCHEKFVLHRWKVSGTSITMIDLHWSFTNVRW